MLYCFDGLVSQRVCYAPSYSSANAVADQMHVWCSTWRIDRRSYKCRDVRPWTCRKDDQRPGESMTLLWTCRRSTFFLAGVSIAIWPGPIRRGCLWFQWSSFGIFSYIHAAEWFWLSNDLSYLRICPMYPVDALRGVSEVCECYPFWWEKGGVLYLNVKRPDLQKCLKALEDNFFFREGGKSFAIIYILDDKKQNKCRFSFE